MKKWLKRVTVAVAALIVVVLLAAIVVWRVRGRQILYGAIFPDASRLLEGQVIPEELSAGAFRADLAFLQDVLPRAHVDFELAFDGEDFAARVAELSAEAADLPPLLRQLELVGMLAAGGTGTGHTMVMPYQRTLDWRVYPLATWWFADGLFVTAASGRYEAAVGSRVTRVGAVAIDEALARLSRYAASDNPSSLRDRVPMLLGMAEPIIALDLATEKGELELGLEGGTTITVEPVALTSIGGMRWSRRMFTPVDGVWSPADTRQRRRNYWFEYDPGSRFFYLQINLVENDGDEGLRQFAERLGREARELDVERFVVDLRANGGGNNELGRALVEVIEDHPVLDRRGTLYVLMGRRTFSAAANLTCALERRTRALFVGETSGFAPDHFGDVRSILLPGSKIVAWVATRSWREDLPGVGRIALEPDLVVPFLARDHFADHDAGVAAIVEHEVEPLALRAQRWPDTALGTWWISPHRRVRFIAEGELDRMEIDAVGRFVSTDLYPTDDGVWRTEVNGMRLEVPGDGPPRLRWNEAVFVLDRADGDRPLALELLAGGEIAAGVAAFRALPGVVDLGAHLELAINRLGYGALSTDRFDDAVEIFRLNTELFTGSANVWDSLGDGLRAAGDDSGARRAYLEALAIDPLFASSRQSLEELGAG